MVIKLQIIIISRPMLQECVSFYFWSPADVPRMQGSAGFCSLVVISFTILCIQSSVFANLWQLCHILALLSISFSVFVFLSHQLIRVVPLLCTGPLSSSILCTCPNYRNLCSLRNFSNLSTPVISRIFSLSVLSFKVFPRINRISVIFSLLSSSTFNAQHSAP